MPQIVIRGVTIDFPFEPYDVQKSYMEKVIESLQKGVNGLLESPTGTGKTLCLLCASLGWLLHEKSKKQDEDALEVSPSKSKKSKAFTGPLPKIIYASRTHTQLTQAISELKRTSYAQRVKNAILGGREQLCIQEVVLDEKSNEKKTDLCARLKEGLGVPDKKADSCAARLKEGVGVPEPESTDPNDVKKSKDPVECQFYKKLKSSQNDEAFTAARIVDIEDLVKIGKELQCCPYYAARSLQEEADIIFMPYNYILYPYIRNSLKMQLENTIIILDEAHNINKICEEAASMKFPASLLAKCLEEVALANTCIQSEPSGSPALKLVQGYSIENREELMNIFRNLEKVMMDIKGLQAQGAELPGKFMLELMAKAEITAVNGYSLGEMTNKIGTYLNKRTHFEPSEINNKTNKAPCRGSKLRKISKILGLIFDAENEDADESCFKVYVTTEQIKNTEGEPKYEPVFNYWCFSAAVNMKQLQNQRPRSILLTSGTLGPLPALALELGIDFPVTLENGHVVGGEQVYVSVVSKGPDGTSLNSSFENRTTKSYIQSLGLTIQNFSRIVPDGILVFFPSYIVLKLCAEEWQCGSNPIWPGIAKEKVVFVESQDKRIFTTNMEGFYTQVQNQDAKGACFMAVCRGKVSEGLDFSDHNGRAVIVTGLPYPPYKDPKVRLKRNYLNAHRRKNPEGLSGHLWYQLEATRAVNQAIGRVIRHRNDYGAILLCDSRFGQQDVRDQLSAWLQPFIQTNDFGKANKQVIEFFKIATASLDPGQTQSGMWNASPSSLSFSPLRLTPGNGSAKKRSSHSSLLPEKKLRMEPSTSTTVQQLPEDECKEPSSSKQVVVRRKLTLSPLKPMDSQTENDDFPLSVQEQQSNYIQQIKNCVPQESYEQLMEAITSYNEKKNFKVLFHVLYSVLGGQCDREHLIAGFEVLLQPNDKEKLKNICANLG